MIEEVLKNLEIINKRIIEYSEEIRKLTKELREINEKCKEALK